MSLVVSQQQAEAPPAAARTAPDSDSDSGMGSPAVTVTTADARNAAPESDDEDVVTHRKPRRNAIVDSEEEEEAAVVGGQRSPASSGEEAEPEGGRRSGGTIRQDPDEGDVKRREKSRRNHEKKKQRSKAMEKLKKKKAERLSEEEEDAALPVVLNDSGCPLGDPELFDAGLEEEEEEAKRRPAERRAARASREAMRQLHSETQRLVRESSLGLPYHVPEPKTIQQFYRRRVRPQGAAMALLKSSRYSELMLETPLAPPPQPEAPPSSGLSTNQSPAEEPESGPMLLLLSETLQESLAADSAEPLPDAGPEQNRAEPRSDPVPPSAPEPARPKKDRLCRLKELGLDPPPPARLSPDDGAFVQLDLPHCNPGVAALKERYLRHVQAPVGPPAERSVQITVIRKDGAPGGQEELRSEAVTVTLKEGGDEPANTKPGEKLLTLKQRLQLAMAQRRQEERARKAELRRLDNEDCGDEEEEEEEDMTDESEEEDVDDLLGGDGGEEDEDKEEEESAAQSSLSPAARTPDRFHTDGTLLLFPGSSCSRTGDGVRKSGPDVSIKPEEDGSLDLPGSMLTSDLPGSMLTSDLPGSMLTSYQPVRPPRAAARGPGAAAALRSPSPCFFRPSILGSASKSSGRLSEPSLCLPVDDSQDLYAAPPSPGPVLAGDSQARFCLEDEVQSQLLDGPVLAGDSQARFCLEDEAQSQLLDGPVLAGDSQARFCLEDEVQSQLLDADGFLNVGPRRGSTHRRRLLLLDSLDENAMDAQMGALLELCSGRFGSAPAGPARDGPPACRSGPGAAQEEQDSMEELMALCSGRFPGPDSADSPAAERETKGEEEGEKEEQEEEEQQEEQEACEFRLLSDVESEKEEEDEDDEEEEELQAVFAPRRSEKKKKMALMDFVESEAELSGSDIGSEEEDGDHDDEYEEEEPLEELPSDEELQNQVNRIHMKQVLDEDKRRLRLYQDRYLADGDLQADGPGRERRFRWRNIDAGFGGSAADGEEDAEDEDDLDPADVQRRKDRLDREQWLRDQDPDGEDEPIGDEDSRFMKLAKKLTARTLQRREPPQSDQRTAAALDPFQRRSQPVQVRRGSLLGRPAAELQRLAGLSDQNQNQNPLAQRSSRGFLFHTLSPGKADQNQNQVARKRSPADPVDPAAKRPCRRNRPAGPNSNPQRSIFSFLDH